MSRQRALGEMQMSGPMAFSFANLLLAALLFAAMFGMQSLGKRLAERDRRLDPSLERQGPTAAEAAVFALLGLLLAFTFSGAASRFDARRQLVLEETNAIGTAWLRIDLLPAESQPAVRDLFRRYLDERIAAYRRADSFATAVAATEAGEDTGKQLWAVALAAAAQSGQVPPVTLMVPALNSMFDIATARKAATRVHPPFAVYLMLGVLALTGALFTGRGLAGRKTRGPLDTFSFTVLVPIVIYVIIDLEFPRFGLIRVDATDRLLVELQATMN